MFIIIKGNKMAEKRDYYEILGVERNASADELKKAYRTIAFKHHPDKSSDPESENIFKEASEAYEVLSNPEKKKIYDTYGHNGLNNSGGFSSGGFDFDSVFGDIFADFFGGGRRKPQRGRDLKQEITLSFKEAVWGVKRSFKIQKHIKCQTCGGKGVLNPDKDISVCNYCKGHGTINQSLGFFSMSQPCPYCGGQGKTIKNPCKSCKGDGVVTTTKEVEVSIPAGVDNGTRLKVQGEGEESFQGGQNGDLYLFINVEPHNFFEREEYNLHLNLEISFLDAILGTQIEIDGIGDDERFPLTIPEGTQQDTVFTIKNKGIKFINQNRRGDLFVKIKLLIPTKLSSKEKDLLLELKSIDEKNNEIEKKNESSIFRKIKEAILG